MAEKFFKFTFLGILLVMLMSVAVAADVAEDTVSDVTTLTDNVEVSNDVNEPESDEILDNSNGCLCTDDSLETVPITPANTTFTVDNNHKYDFSGNFTNVTYNYENLDTVVFMSSNHDAIFYNSTITLNGQNLCICNLTFINDETSGNPLTITDSSNVCICHNTFNVTKTTQEETYSVNVIDSDNVTVKNNDITMSGAPQGVNWTAGGVVEYSGIVFSNVSNSNIINNALTLENSTVSNMYDYSTMEAITVRSASENDTIDNNTITITGSDYIYGISISENAYNITITYNSITMTGTNLISGIQLSSTNNSTIRGNQITGYCNATKCSTISGEAFAYGITVLTGTWGAQTSESTYNIIDSNNVTLNSTIAYAYELSNADYTQITNNNATVTGNVVMALGMYNSSYCNISGNRFIVSGNTRELCPNIYEAIYPVTTGIKINETSYDNVISGNTIIVTDNNNTDIYDIILENTYNTTITENYMTASYDEDEGFIFRILDHGSETNETGDHPL